jgi:hypothetical protein
MVDFVVPGVRQFPAHPLNVRTRANVFFEGCVVHTTVGGNTLAGLGSWFGGGNIAEGIYGSTQFGVSDEPEDVVGQYVQLSQQPIAHGAEEHIHLPIMRGNEAYSTNDYLVGWELLDAGIPGNHTPRQLDRLARHMAYVWRTQIAPHAAVTGAKVDRDHILGHYQLAPSTRTCPVWPEERFTWLIGRVNELLATAPPPEPPPPVTDWEAEAKKWQEQADYWKWMHTNAKNEVGVWLNDDEAGAQMRRTRLSQI